MTANILDLIRRTLPADFAEQAGKRVGESPGASQTALSAALPALVAGIAQKGATAEGAQNLLSLFDDPSVSTVTASNAESLPRDGPQAVPITNADSRLPGALFGDKSDALARTLASIAGLRNSQSAASLLGLLAPIVLGFIRKLVEEQGLGASGLASLLAGQATFLQGALDRRLTGALGFASPSALLDALGGKATAAMGVAGAAIGSAGNAIESAGATGANAKQRAGAVAPSAVERTAATSAAQRTPAQAKSASTLRARRTSGVMRWLPWLIGAIVVLFVLSRVSTCTQPVDQAATAPPSQAAPAIAPAPPPQAPAPPPQAPAPPPQAPAPPPQAPAPPPQAPAPPPQAPAATSN